MVRRYHARIYSLAYGVLRNPEDAEEAAQDAFWTLYRKIGTFDETKKFFSWFYRVALNQAYSRARRRPVPTVPIDETLPRFDERGRFVLSDFPDWSAKVEDDVSARELAAKAGEYIAELPPAYRDVIWMADVEEMAPADIAETLEISIPAFKSRLHRARLHVRETADAGDAGGAREGRGGGIVSDNCRKFVLDLLGDYEAGALPSAEREALERHIGMCPPCVNFLVHLPRHRKVPEVPEALRYPGRPGRVHPGFCAGAARQRQVKPPRFGARLATGAAISFIAFSGFATWAIYTGHWPELPPGTFRNTDLWAGFLFLAALVLYLLFRRWKGGDSAPV